MQALQLFKAGDGAGPEGVTDWIGIWMAVGLALLILEMLVPGVFLMWIGLAACGTGLLTLAFAFGGKSRSLRFGVLTAITLAAGMRLRGTRAVVSHRNRRSGWPARDGIGVSGPRWQSAPWRFRLGRPRAAGYRASGSGNPAARGAGRWHGADRAAGFVRGIMWTTMISC